MSKKEVSRNVAATTNLKAFLPKKRNLIPVLAKVLVAQHGDRLVAVATDLDVYGVATVENLAPGLYDIIGKEFCPNTDGSIKVESFPVGWADLYATAQGCSHGRLSVYKGEFAEALSCISHEESRYTLNAVMLTQHPTKPNAIIMASTDGHRMAYQILHGLGFVKGQKLIPRRAVELATKLIDKGLVADVTLGETMFSISAGNLCMFGRQTTGQFPNYEAILSVKLKEQWKIPVVETLEVLKSFAPFIALQGHQQELLLTRTDTNLAFTVVAEGHVRRGVVDAEVVKHNSLSSLDVPQTIIMPRRVGQEYTFGIRPEYLIDALKHCTTKYAYVSFRGKEHTIHFSEAPLPFLPAEELAKAA